MSFIKQRLGKGTKNVELPAFPLSFQQKKILVLKTNLTYRNLDKKVYIALASSDPIYTATFSDTGETGIYFNGPTTIGAIAISAFAEWITIGAVSSDATGWSFLQILNPTAQNYELAKVSDIVWSNINILDFTFKTIVFQGSNASVIEDAAEPPMLIGVSGDKSLPIGGSSQLKVTAITVQTPNEITYTWYKQGPDWTKQEPVSEEYNFYPETDSFEKAGEYYCVVYNTYRGSTTCAITRNIKVELRPSEQETSQASERIIGICVGQQLRKMIEGTFSRPIINWAIESFDEKRQIINNIGTTKGYGFGVKQAGSIFLEYELNDRDLTGILFKNGGNFSAPAVNISTFEEDGVLKSGPFTWIIGISKYNGKGQVCSINENDNTNNFFVDIDSTTKKLLVGSGSNYFIHDNIGPELEPNAPFTLVFVYDGQRTMSVYINNTAIKFEGKFSLNAFDNFVCGHAQGENNIDILNQLKVNKFIVYNVALTDLQIEKALKGVYV